MKIRLIEISKFRSIENGSFHIEDIVGIVGQNNSGKTAILRALNSFFNPQLELQYYLNGVNLYSTNRAIPRIKITFENVPNKPIYSPFVQNGKITIQQEYNKTRARLDYQVLNNGSIEAATEPFLNELKTDVQYILIPADRTASFDSKNGNPVLKELLKTFFFVILPKETH